ncbi:MAG: glycogen synthase GlgA [Pseudomonadota bacterium]
MKVLSVASEVFPLIKTGGLADVAGALPGALALLGVEMRTLLPAYRQVLAQVPDAEVVAPLPPFFGPGARLLSGRSAGLDLLLLDAPELFDRPGGPYVDATGQDWPDNWRRFAALGRAALDIAKGLVPGFVPDLVHAHDWLGGLVPVYMKFGDAAQPTVITIHNIAFQGQFGADVFPLLGLPAAAFNVDGLEYYGDVGFLKGGVQVAHAVTTVSPTYAREIREPQFGMGLEGLIRARASDVHGIVNGIDTDVWNPETDPHVEETYTARSLARRKANRAAVEEAFALDADGSPIFTVISRLTWQKGMDALAEAVDGLVAAGGRLAVLGSGDRALEDAFAGAAARHAGRVGAFIGYDEPLSHLVQSGADAILIPSRFEPCGLTQLYGLRYGCIPVVARTGGLADTVIDANSAALGAGVATGIQFNGVTAADVLEAVERACALHAEPKVWARMQRNGMASDVSWTASAGAYAALYRSLL